MNKVAIEAVKDEWRKLGYYFELNKDEKKWVFISSKNGIEKFIDQIKDYIQNETNKDIGEHDHWGPYGDLKIMTTSVPQITNGFIGGNCTSFLELTELIEKNIKKITINESFFIQEEYVKDARTGIEFVIKDDDFDPASADKQLWL
jgi:hypothetical protein